MAAVTLTQALTLIEATILDLSGARIADELRGVVPQQRAHKGVAVWRETTTNTELYRDQNLARVEDVIVVRTSWRLSPKNQRASMDAAHDWAASICVQVADVNGTFAPLHPTFLSEEEEHEGEWLTITQRYRMTRDHLLGGDA